MTTTNNAPALPLDIEQTVHENVAPPEYCASAPREAVTGSPRLVLGNLPHTSVSVMVVIDDNGYLMPVCTAGDLLRWCKTAWRAAQV
jgi:hypothetical protein